MYYGFVDKIRHGKRLRIRYHDYKFNLYEESVNFALHLPRSFIFIPLLCRVTVNAIAKFCIKYIRARRKHQNSKNTDQRGKADSLQKFSVVIAVRCFYHQSPFCGGLTPADRGIFAGIRTRE